MNPLNIRLQALDWLFTATRYWLFQSERAAQQFPHKNDVDWKAIGRLAYVHNIEPLLYWMVLNTEFPAQIPEWLKQRWEQAYFGNFLKNEEYFELLKTLLAKCKEEGVPIIVLKGPALIGRIYKDPALRTLSDLDILCSQDDLRRIVKIGRDMGYTTMTDGDGPASTHHVAMYQAASGAILEFHFMPYEVIQNHARFMQLAWSRKKWINIGDFYCPVLCLEMELLFNIAHLVQHQFDVSLKHYLDIAGLLVFCEGQLNRDGIGTLFRYFGLEQAFALTTEFISTMIHLPHVFRAVPRLNHKDSSQREFDASLRDLLALLDEERLLDVRGVIWSFRIAIGNRKGFGNKVAYVIKALFPFSGNLTDHGIRLSGDVRYFLHQYLFYGKRLLFTLMHLPKERLSNNKHSLARERAGAKDRITRQLLRIAWWSG